MAFHQPTRHPVHRSIRLDTTTHEPEPETLAVPQPISDSQTWVLFSPETDAGTTISYLSSVQESSQKTPGRSHLSDIGSAGLNTLARSDLNSNPIPAGLSDVLSDSVLEDDAELDGLDSHLPDFRSIPNQQLHASNTVLPTHDGLGSFRLDTTTAMQEQLYAFERYNPRRVKRRRESFDLSQLELESERAAEAERNRRVEAWRLDQSRTFLEEIQKETRRRRTSGASALRPRISRTASQEGPVTVGSSSAVEMTPETTAAGSEWHEQDDGSVRGDQDGVWSRLTRRFMKDYMGIDDHMLSVLFGEALPEVTEEDLSSTPRASTAFGAAAIAAEEPALQETSSWQMRLLERVARELGIFVHHMSHPHPGAFSTYSRVHQMVLPYAGLPAIPETAPADVPNTTEAVGESASSPAIPQFRPTVAALDIPGRASTTDLPPEDIPTDSARVREGAFTQQEWEQDLDIRLVFRYVRSRFLSSRSAASSTHHHCQPSRPLTPSETAARAARAARVRAHHPLVNRSRQPAGVAEGRRTAATAMTVGLGVGNFVVRHASSCASQSTKRRSSLSVSSRASERYGWMGSMGSAGWGEV